jgi:hypothetical protein
MTTEREPDALAEALRDAAFSFEPPPPTYFHARAVRRTRQIKRRRAAMGGALACLLTLGAAGTLAVTLTGRAPREVTAAGPSATTQVHTAVAEETTPTPSASATAGTGGVTEQEVLQAFLSALPSEADALQTQNPEQGVSAPWATGPQVNSLSGDWYVAAGASLKSSSAAGSSTVSLDAQRGVQTATCAEAVARDPGTCTTSHVDGGTLILDKTPHHPDPIWDYSWISPAGNEVDLSIGDDSVSDFALTEQQVIGVLADPVWGGIAARLPAPVCVGGDLTETYATAAGSNPAIELKCSLNGKLYPMT